MDAKRTRLNLRIASLVLIGLAVAAVAVTILLPVVSNPSSLIADTHTLVKTPASTTPSVPQWDLSDVMNVDLHRPLADAPPATSAPAVIDDVLSGLRLSGTIIDPQQSYAVFKNARGDEEMKSVGEKVGNADVAIISQDSVTLRFNGRSIVLHIVKPVTGQSGL